MKNLTVLSLLLFLLSGSLRAQVVFPAPNQLETSEGTFSLSNNTKFQGNTPYAAKMAYALSVFGKQYGQNGKSHVVRVIKEPVGEMPQEGYNLQVFADSIIVKASSDEGLFHAKESLEQLMRYGKGTIRCCIIRDAPRYSWRGFMLDESRHFFGKEKVKQYLDIMASLHLNVFHWHLTDETGWRIEIKKYPKLTQKGAVGNWHDPEAAPTFYTQEDIKEIVAYANERQIMILPEIDMPGHATAACSSYPELASGGDGRWQYFTYNPCNEKTYQFISDVLDEVIRLFPSPYIHVGGDEVRFGNQIWFTGSEFQKFIKDHNLSDEKGLEYYFIRRVADIVRSKGKTMIGWDEIVDADVAPEKAVVMWWRHDKRDQLLKALERGYRVILTPRKPLYADFTQFGAHKVGRQWNGYNTIESLYAFPVPVSHLIEGYNNQILGMQMSAWTERIADGRRLDFMTFPRLVALAEAAWTNENVKECSLFMQRLPLYLDYLDSLGIYYFNPLNPSERTEPTAPEKKDELQNG